MVDISNWNTSYCYVTVFDRLGKQYEYAVVAIKQAVEKNRYRAAKAGNVELLSLYYGIGKYVSENTRNGVGGQMKLNLFW